MSLRVLIVDDEPLARERIRALLAGDPDIEILGECASGEDALRTIRVAHPDLLFLDVQMPGMDGFDTLAAAAAADPSRVPAVIFVTAYDQHAVRAFEVHAQDYLLKPFDRARFDAALGRAKAAVASARGGGITERLAELLDGQERARRTLRRLVVNASGRIVFLNVSEIDWIEAAGNYVRLHLGTDAHLLRETMNSIESRLNPELFYRIHRSHIVNIERIKELQPWFNGEYVVILRNGARLTLSRGYREKLQEKLGKPL